MKLYRHQLRVIYERERERISTANDYVSIAVGIKQNMQKYATKIYETSDAMIAALGCIHEIIFYSKSNT